MSAFLKELMFKNERGRRFKNLWITPELLLNMLFSPQQIDAGTIKVLEVNGIPEGCYIDAVMYSDDRRAFCFRLFHSSFEEVEPAHNTPEITAEIVAKAMQVMPLSARKEFL